MAKHTVDITDATFKDEVIKSQGLVLVDFWGAGCAPCERLSPVLDELAQDKAGVLKVGKVNVKENPILSDVFNIRAIPFLVLFRDGQIVEHCTGAPSKRELQDWMNGHINTQQPKL